MTSDTTKADEIALELEQAIVSGELPPGSVLRQDDLSERFRVSRTPIREALRRLAALGLVLFEPNRGVRVRTLSEGELYEAFLVRAELEGLATELAATKRAPEDVDELRVAEAEFALATERLLRASRDERRAVLATWVQANHAFHDVVYRIAAVPMVERIAKSARRTFSGPAVWQAGGAELDALYELNARQHSAICEAVAAGSGAGARVLAREHVLASHRLLVAVRAQLSEEPRRARLRRSA
ncbi:MAG: GntR family transcriptional regulator [Thermoleophilia bacterium]|nr:GntR family transcriptional regulator [Thermoleophilia bacterium]